MKTILVVDDEMEVANAVEAILEDEGFAVLVAGDGREAIEVLKDKTPDLVISDVMMPFCNGKQLLQHLRSNDKYKSTPVIFMSAANHDSDDIIRKEIFLKKPFDLDKLLDSVNKALKV